MFFEMMKDLNKWTKELSNQAKDYRISQKKIITKENFDRIVSNVRKDNYLNYVSPKKLKENLPLDPDYESYFFDFVKNNIYEKLNKQVKSIKLECIYFHCIVSNLNEKYPNRDLDHENYELFKKEFDRFNIYMQFLERKMKSGLTFSEIEDVNLEVDFLLNMVFDLKSKMFELITTVYPEFCQYDDLPEKFSYI